METPWPTSIRRLVFWEPCTSPHKADLFSALVRLAPECEIVQCAERELTEDRTSLGWSVDAADGYSSLIAPGKTLIEEITSGTTTEALHVFSGIRWVPTIVRGLAAARSAGARIAIMSEPRVREGWKGELRFAQSWLTEGWLRRRAEFVLAIGRNGPPWFAGVGYPPERIFPFGYFVDPPQFDAVPPDASLDENMTMQIGYLGRLVEAKGVFDVIESAALLNGNCVVQVGGAGADEARLRALCTQLNVNAQFHGVIPMRNIAHFLTGLDVLVLASTTKDGWGVVVSEALMCGTAVVATDCVGASVLLDPPSLGRVVPARRPACIAEAILDLAACGAFAATARAERATWAKSVLSASAGADYLLRVVAWSEGKSHKPPDFYLSTPAPAA